MLWIKSFHIVFVASWFAGLFYLPRIFVNLAMLSPDSSVEVRERLLLMATKLYRFMGILALPAIGLGLWLWLSYGFRGGWLHAKLLLVVLALVYHWYCGRLLERFSSVAGNSFTTSADFRLSKNKLPSHVWLRWFNEVPVLLLTATVILVVVKPF